MDLFWFWLLFFPLLVFIAIFSAQRRRRRLRLIRVVHTQPGVPVIYTVPAPVYAAPVHNNFPNTRHVAPSTLVVEQRLNQHYSIQQQPPPAYHTIQQSQQQRY